MYRQLIKNNTLFTYLTPLLKDPPGPAWPRTTSPLEGGINAGLKRVLEHHRGMSTDHARRAVEWYPNSQTETPHQPVTIIKPHHYMPGPPTVTKLDDHDGPREIDTAYNTEAPWEGGIWQHKGWAGRHHK